MNPPAAVQFKGLSKRYGDFTAVAGLQLEIPAGEIFALLGPNGAGKTTTFRMLMGLLRASAGTAEILGLDCFAEKVEVKRHVGYLPDEPVFYDYLRGREILGFVAGMHGLSDQEAAGRGKALVERLDLTEALDEFAMNYSKGMKKKLALACALIHQPEVLVLDEPTNGLDPHAARTLWEMIQERAALGTTVLYSTHLLDQAEKQSHGIGIMHKGSLVAAGSMEQLRANEAGAKTLESIFFNVTKDVPR